MSAPTSKFVRIHTSTLIADLPLQFDVFLKLGDKHIHYLRQSESVEMDRLKRLRTKKVKHLFIPTEMEAEYQKFLDRGLDLLKKKKDIPVELKSQMLIGQSKAASQGMFDDPTKKENFTRAQDVVGVQVEHLIKNPAALEQMLKLENFDKTVYQHCVNVSTIAVGLAHFLGAPENVCQVVGTGALMHDMGKAKLGLDKLLPGAKLTPDQEEKMRQHPRAGCEDLQDKKYISKDVLDIILLHEERIDGKGYPAGVKKLDQIFQVVGLANMFDRMVTYESKTPREAYEAIAKMDPPPYDKDLIAGLKDVLVTNKML